MSTMEEWVVVFVVVELAGLALLVALSCWCCRHSVRRTRDQEEAHDLPMARVVGARSAAAAGADGGKGERGEDRDGDDELVSGGLWGFITGYPAANEPPHHTSRGSSTQQQQQQSQQRGAQSTGGVEVVNISVNVTALDEEEDGKALAAAGGDRKSGSAA